MEEIRCIGCGAVIQSEDPNKIGYVPQNIIDRGDFSHLYCKRCHNIRSYGAISRNDIPHEEYYEIIKSIADLKGTFVYITDLFNFPSSLDKKVINLIKNNNVILVGNKIDLFPKSFNETNVKKWALNIAKKSGLNVKEFILTSTKNKYHIDELVGLIDRYATKKDIYVIGQTNVGKSSIINAILRSINTVDYDVLTTSVIPATTIDLVAIPYTLDTCIYDTPGMVSEDNLLSLIESEDYKNVLPQREIRPSVFQMEAGNSILLNGFGRFDFVSGPRQGFVFYLSNMLKIQRSKTENATRIFNTTLEELFSYKTKNLKFEETKLKIAKPSYVFMTGLGFIYITKECEILITHVKGTSVVVTDVI